MKDKQNYEAMEPSKKRMLLEKKQAMELLQINLNYKRKEQNNTKNGLSKETTLIKQTS